MNEKTIIKIRIETNERAKRKTREKINETKIRLFEKIHKIDKLYSYQSDQSDQKKYM